MIYGCTIDEAPSYLECLFDRLSETSTRELRNTETNLRVPFLRTTCDKNCFSFRGAKLWNGLDAKSKLQKDSNNSNPVSKTPEHKGTLFYSYRSRTFIRTYYLRDIERSRTYYENLLFTVNSYPLFINCLWCRKLNKGCKRFSSEASSGLKQRSGYLSSK